MICYKCVMGKNRITVANLDEQMNVLYGYEWVTCTCCKGFYGSCETCFKKGMEQLRVQMMFYTYGRYVVEKYRYYTIDVA